MRAALRGLTTRGRSFLAAGVAAALGAVLLGERDLLRVAVLLAVLPLLAAWYVGRSRHRLGTHRELEPARLPAGEPARVRLHLHNAARLPIGTLLLEEGLPVALGGVPRLVLEKLAAGASTNVAYTVRPPHRGRYPIGPLRARLTDPFGLCRLDRTFAEVASLTVLPRTEALPAVRLAGVHTGTGESRGRAVAVHGEDDTATREYRHGDDLRRVHWRSTARAGELMVRREEQPRERRATILLDNRAAAHLGDGADSTFEWAVSAAASLIVHLRRGGHKVRLVCAPPDVERIDAPPIDQPVHDAATEMAAMDRLADVGPRRADDLRPAVDRARRAGERGLVVAVLGTCDTAAARHLLGLAPGADRGVALVVDPGWPGAAGTPALTAGPQLLRDAGWRVVTRSPGESVAAVWERLGAADPVGAR
ncbi:membrane protein [Pilimelia anulata]|uniref:Membrane protein n=1 Tax=Pilimelia anulata TaxID=53371 RepID=A0A8J3B0Y1_9ACTN|nr:DUF58 domain-containing protein [Pilimelia anulata]GGJ85452.1 membrane protein [Pilimelia anulata]